MTTTKLTKEAVEERVAEIRAVAEDDERAHGMEDALYLDVLRQIALGKLKGAAASDAAFAALASRDIEFSRWGA